MLKRITYVCCFLLAVAVANVSKADLILRANSVAGVPTYQGPFGGPNNVTLAPGEEVTLLISLEIANSAFQTYQGGDFTINAGGGGTFQPGPLDLLDGYPGGSVGNWFLPDVEATSRSYSGGPNGFQFTTIPGIPNSAAQLGVAAIVLRAGNVAGDYQATFSGVLQLDGAFLDIVTTSQPFSYSVGVVPEPSSAALLGLAACGFVVRRRRS